MSIKHARRQLPSGYSPSDFEYKGRPAKTQGDFGSDVGIADGACVNQFGESNNSKHYHGGVVQSSDGKWWAYFEWGRIKPGPSWSGNSFTGNSQDFQFIECSGEDEARKEFASKLKSKNLARLEEKTIAGAKIWVAKVDKKGKAKDGYIVMSLATREKGLPDAAKIKDDAGVGNGSAKKAAPKKAAPQRTAAPKGKTFQPQVVSLAKSLVGGTATYTKALTDATGVAPTMDAIVQVRDSLIPAALKRIKATGADISKQARDKQLQDISRMVYSMVPRYIPRQGLSPEEAILSSANVLTLQNDLDAFEAALESEDFQVASPTVGGYDPDAAMNANLRWIDPRSQEGRWLAKSYESMSKNSHGYLRGRGLRILNMFAVERPDRDRLFMAAVRRVAQLRQGKFNLRANLQPDRIDMGSDADLFKQANVIMSIHGTRAVNIGPIMGSNFRLPRSLPGAQITGANFGHGIYFATDWRKSYGYTGHRNSYWCSGGQIQGRGFFMFLNDQILGDAYRAPRTGSWNSPPDGKDSVFGVGGDRGHRLENDEHIIFDPNYQRIRYLIEGDM